MASKMIVSKSIDQEGPLFIMKPYLNIQQFIQSEEGATAIEYALMASLIAAATVGAQTTMGATVVNMYTVAVGTISAAMS
jgi:pilus assembly protein Flp/PilA